MHYLIKPANQYINPESFLNDYGCYRISKYFEIHQNGEISICCYSWLPKLFGNILTDTPEEILNNIERLSIIKDMDNGKFTECNDHCPSINSLLNNKKNYKYIVPISKLPKEKEKEPIVINFSYDLSCNYQCPSCRSELILYSLGENSKVTKIHEKVVEFINYLLNKGERLLLNITGSGDAFASPTYWNYIKNLKSNDYIGLKLYTNGMSMTENKLLEIEHLWDNIHQMHISLDAVKAETYNIVRKNGSFDKVKSNLKTLNRFVKNKSFKNLKALVTNFTVQKTNYKEIVEYAKWQLEYDQVTDIYFNLVVQWNHISNLQFKNNFDLSESEKRELSILLKDEVFNHKKMMLGNLQSIKNL